jgi:hypothetical protein
MLHAMTQLASQSGSSVESIPVAPDAPAKPAQRWLGYVTPVVQRITGVVAETQSAVEKRLGFCPGKELLKATSKGLDALADGLHSLAARLRTATEGAPRQVDDPSAQGASPQAQA